MVKTMLPDYVVGPPCSTGLRKIDEDELATNFFLGVSFKQF